MDIFFTHRYKYTVNDTIDSVRANLESITDRRWYDFPDNITGRLNSDGSFKLTHKWSFAVIRWIENSPAYLSGTLTAEGNTTIIETTLRPNSGLVMFFYLLTILFVCELFGINTFIQGSKTFKLLFFPFFNLILFGLMKMFTTGLRNRFERLLRLQRDS
jgi:CBS domain containing-hemolysin-like protein